MREIARAQQGFFPTQTRIVKAVASLFRLTAAQQNPIVVLDAGCGTGDAVHDLHGFCVSCKMSLLGIESDKNRYEQATKVLDQGLWSAIEDSTSDGPVSLLWFNPPYDRIRGAGRTEMTLFNRVKDWPARSTGVLLMIVPDYVLADEEVGLAIAVERDYELIGLWRYPEPEYQDFKQCVLVARRREKGLNKTKLVFPRWACNPEQWPVLQDNMKPVVTLHPVQKVPTLRRTKLSNDVIVDVVSKSPLRAGLLREASSQSPEIGRPLLPVKPGHLALLLAGGLADGVIEAGKERFLLKGTLSSAIRRISTKDHLDTDGSKIGEIDTYRTRYEMNVRCLRSNGSIENYTSAEPETEELETEVSEE